MFFCFENDNNKKNKIMIIIIIIIIIIITKIKKNLIGLRMLWELLKSLKKIHDHFILVMTTLWTSCSLYETRVYSILSRFISSIPSYPSPFHSILVLLFFSILFYSILFYSCLVYSLIGKNHYCPTKHLKVTNNSYAD